MGHDRSVSVVQNGILIGSLAAERIDRIKHSMSFKVPFETIDKLLDYLKINIFDIKYIGISYAAVKIENLEKYYYDEIVDYYGYWDFTIIPVSHHLAHAASTYYTSNFKKALVFIADGGGDLVDGNEESESVYIGTENGLELVEQRTQSNIIHTLTRKQFHLYPFMNDKFLEEQISIAKKYEQITYMIGFSWNQAGKTMGLASYGKDMLQSTPIKLKNIQFDLKMADMLKEIYQAYVDSGLSYIAFIRKYRQDIARSIQSYTENIIFSILDYLLKKYEIYEVCLAGGLFLNCLLNHKILERYPEVRLHICPAAGDDGQSIGAAFVAYQRFNDKKLYVKNKTIPYLGLSYNDMDILESIKKYRLTYDHFSDKKDLSKIIADEINNNKIIGFFTGRSEIGPRALCHRSIIANATWDGMKDYINERVKHREAFRPFAPVVLKEFEKEYFHLKQTSPYMLLAPLANKKHSNQIPAVVHVDQTARVQSVSKEDNPFIYDVIFEFYQITGIPVILNTSFNDNGEPIVESPNDAINTFLTTNIDILVLENYIIYKNTEDNNNDME